MTTEIRCHYEVLEVEKTASVDDIKKQYRKLALKFHPDRNYGNEDWAAVMFKQVSAAYTVLTDPHERQWYDDHRDSILRGGSGTKDGDENSPSGNLWKYFTSSCYNGMDDEKDGFYAVYRGVFDNIALQEHDNSSSKRAKASGYNSFGDSKSSDGDVEKFYAFWAAFATKMSFSWEDKYDVREAPNRDYRRAMEKENLKVRDAAKKTYSNLVKNLVSFLKRRDPRILQIEMEKARKLKEAQEAAEQRRLLQQKMKEEQRELRRQMFADDEEERQRRENERKSAFLLADESSDEDIDDEDSNEDDEEEDQSRNEMGEEQGCGEDGELLESKKSGSSNSNSNINSNNGKATNQSKTKNGGKKKKKRKDTIFQGISGYRYHYEVEEEEVRIQKMLHASKLVEEERGDASILSSSSKGEKFDTNRNNNNNLNDDNNNNKNSHEEDVEGDEDEDDEDVVVDHIFVLRCEICRKDFKSEPQLAQHLASKVHRKKAQELEKQKKGKK